MPPKPKPVDDHERPYWHHWCLGCFENHCSRRYCCANGKRLHDEFQKITREMLIGKASAVMLGFLLKLALGLTILRLCLGPLSESLKVDKIGNLKAADTQDSSTQWTIVFVDLVVFFILLAIAATIATVMHGCLPSSEMNEHKKEMDLEVENDDEEEDESDADDKALTSVMEKKVAETAKTTWSEMCKTYISGSKLIPAWAWKDFIAATAVAIAAELTGPILKEALEEAQNNSTSVLATTTFGATVGPSTTAGIPLEDLKNIVDAEALRAACIAIGILLVSAIVSLIAEDISNCIGSCECIHLAFDTWSNCMALAAGWSLNNVVNQVISGRDALGPIFRLSYLFILAMVVHCIQTRLTRCRNAFDFQGNDGKDSPLPTLPRVCKRIQRLLVKSGNFIIAWAWKGFLSNEVFAHPHFKPPSMWHSFEQAMYVTFFGGMILCLWPCCCGSAGGEIEGVVHTTIGINVGWFWAALARDIFKERIITDNDNVPLGWVWLLVFVCIAIIVIFGLVLEFVMLCAKNFVDSTFDDYSDIDDSAE